MKVYRNNTVQFTCFVTLHFIRCFGAEDFGIASSVGDFAGQQGSRSNLVPRDGPLPATGPAARTATLTVIHGLAFGQLQES